MKPNPPRMRAAMAVAGVAVVVSAAGCSSGSGTSNDPGTPSSSQSAVVTDGTVKLALPAVIPSFDPYLLSGAGLAKFAYDSLVNVTTHGDVVSGLAAKWQASATSVTFTLRPDVTCSDGAKMTAQHVAAVLTYASDPKNQLTSARVVLPAVPFTATGDDASGTVTIKMAKPFSFPLRTIGLLPIICPDGLKNPKSLTKSTDGTGPYVLSSYSSAGPYEFTVRKGYTWGPGGASTGTAGQPAKIVVSVVPNESTAANLLTTGGLNIASVSGPDAARLTAAGVTPVSFPVNSGFTLFNQAPNRPLSDVAVRKALVEALDRQKVADVAVGGKGTPATGISSTDTVCHADLVGENLPDGDAMATLQAAGWSKVGGKLEKAGHQLSVRVITDGSGRLSAVAELMANTWQALGIKAGLVTQDENAFLTTLSQTGDWDVMVGSNSYRLPSTLSSIFSGPVPPNGINIAHIHNTEYDQLVDQALTKQGDASCPYWQQASAALLKAADLFPVSDAKSYFWGHKVTFSLTEMTGGQMVDPTSIRLLK